MPRALMITNPVAARTTPGGTTAVRDRLLRAGWRIAEAETQAVGHARELAETAVADGVEAIVVFGGDGTTMQVAAALVGTGIPLGLIPGGTGNLLAGNLGIPSAPDRAGGVVLSGRVRRIDLGRMERADGPHWFAVACGAGLDARIMKETPLAAKRRWGIGAYFATSFRTLPGVRSQPFRVTIDGTSREFDATAVLVANCGEVIPGVLRLGAGIALDDGVFDVIAVRARGINDAVQLLWHAFRGHRPGHDANGRIAYARGQEIRVETDPAQPVQLDGDVYGDTPFVTTVVPGAIVVFAP